MKSYMFKQVIEVGEIMAHIGFQDKVLISQASLPFPGHSIVLRLKQIDLPSSEINCFWYSFYLSWKSCDTGEMFT